MIRSILSWSTALLVLCSGLLASCDDKDEGGGNPPAPAVTLAVGDAASNTLKFTLTLSDADNADGYLQASRLVIGRGIQPEVNASWGAKLAWIDESKHQRMAGGSLHVEQVEVYRELEISLDWLTDVDRRRLTEAQRRSGKRGEVFVSLYPGAGGAKERDHGLVGRMATTNPFSVDNQLFHSHSLRVVEG